MKIKGQVKAKWLLPILTLVCCLSIGRTHAQSAPVTLKVTDAPLEQVLDAIEKQTPYLFVYDKNVDVARKVTINTTDTPLKSVLNTLFGATNTAYAVENTSVVLSVKNDGAQPSAKSAEITGEVVDAAGNAVIGAAVIVKGTTIGTSTGVTGGFALQVPPPAAEAVLSVNYLGYEPQEVPVGGRTFVKIVLKESSVDVDAVVVTALGIKRSEKALSYNVTQVNTDDIVTVKDANFINSLNGKVAGLNINASSSGVGGASKVVMRGTRGIEQSSNALYVIDGIPMYSLSASGGSEEFASQGSTEAIADINPEDIESMSVLSGAAAAALYGSHASNGAIVITTKRGSAGRTSVTVSSNTEVLSPFVMHEFQDSYGTSSGEASWGAKLNRVNRYGYSPRDDYFQTGVTGTETVTFSTGTDRNQTYMSAGAVNSRGIIPNNGYSRYNFTFRNTTSFLKDKMKLDVGAQYIIQEDRNMTNQGIYSNPLVSAYLFPRGNDWEDYKMYERYDPARKIYTQYWPQGGGSFRQQNPYWINYRNLRENDKNRYMLSAALSYEILDWLSVSGRIRIDNSTNDYTEKLYASGNSVLTEGSDNGLYGITTTKDKQTYGDVLLNINKTFGENWSLQANVGASFSNARTDAMKVSGPIAADALANYFTIWNLDKNTTKREQSGWQEQTQSVFASVEVGYKNAYYLTLTGRNDWPSQLAGPKSMQASFFYPSVGASVVLSEIIPNMPKNLSYLKLRGSWASVGLPFARFLANPTFEWNSSTGAWSTESTYPLYNLKPERTDSWEIGLTARFLRHFNLDLSYYDTKTYNQTMDAQLSATAGYSKFYAQTGNVRNYGVEMTLGYKNTWGKFSWETNYTLSANKNKILELVDGYVHPLTGETITKERLDVGGLSYARFLLKKGGSLGDLWSLADLQRDSDGAVYIDEKGEMTVNTTAEDIYLGSVFPKANMAWRNDFRWGNFNFGFLVTARLGGVAYSATQAVMDSYGVSKASGLARDRGGVMINGGDLVDAQAWYSTIGADSGVPQFYTYSATNVRLQEATIGYTIPKKKLGDIVEINISLVGRNLWMIYNKAPFDPEAVATTGNYYQGIDYFMMPSLRSVGFNLRLKF